MWIRDTNKKGFTLIELMVVVSIIALLTSVVLSALNLARAKARDTKRVADLKELQKALELYYDSFSGYTAGARSCASDDSFSGDCGGAGSATDWHVSSDLRALVTNKFIPELPRDPLNTNCNYYRFRAIMPGETVPNVLGGGTCSGPAGRACGYYLATRFETKPNTACSAAATPAGLAPPATACGDWGYCVALSR